MKIGTKFAIFLLCHVVVAPQVMAQNKIDEGWWVVVGSFRNDDGSQFQSQSVRQAIQRVKACGVVPFNDFSFKFSGFRKGYDVVVVGPYPDKDDAERYLNLVKRCIPNAYLKAARYLGE